MCKAGPAAVSVLTVSTQVIAVPLAPPELTFMMECASTRIRRYKGGAQTSLLLWDIRRTYVGYAAYGCMSGRPWWARQAHKKARAHWNDSMSIAVSNNMGKNCR